MLMNLKTHTHVYLAGAVHCKCNKVAQLSVVIAIVTRIMIVIVLILMITIVIILQA